MSENLEVKLTEENKSIIIRTLEERNATLPCPRCGGTSFYVADGLVCHILQKPSLKFSIRGAALMNAVVVCDNCGFTSEHSLGTLGILDEVLKNG